MFKRKIYSKLLSWKEESNGNTALLIEGSNWEIYGCGIFC